MDPIRHSRPICLIAAMDETRAIGRNNDIPWRVPGEQSRFKKLTLGKPIIMGRNTYDSIGRALPGRTTIVVSRISPTPIPDAIVVSSIPQAIEVAESQSGDEILIAGGEQIYRAFMPVADKIYLTCIHHSFGGDRYFPDISEADFVLAESQRVEAPISYTYLTYQRCRGDSGLIDKVVFS
ncbi:dihydrofolate reductase [Bradyrhizobium barranii]|uniref:dihydrofolate reductase n=1 Tax=Bradyrhizobium TaxID=374 RepID=UPI003F1F53C7